MSWQATHEDDAAPVEPDHGGQELSQAPDLTHQVDLHIFFIKLIKYLIRSSSGLLGFPAYVWQTIKRCLSGPPLALL
jgi:hypothetical protein